MKRHYILVMIALFTQQRIWADATIRLFLRAYPAIDKKEYKKELVKNLKTPGDIDFHTLQGMCKSVTSGIFATYAGYFQVSEAVSNCEAEISVPRMHQKPLIYLLITTHITPNIITGNTIHHWEIEPGFAAAMYRFEYQHNEQENLFFWKVEEVELPENNRIPLETIILFTKPKYVYIPEGIIESSISKVDQSIPNMVLPDIFIKKNIKLVPSVFRVLNFKQFFGQIPELTQQRDTSYSEHLVP